MGLVTQRGSSAERGRRSGRESVRMRWTERGLQARCSILKATCRDDTQPKSGMRRRSIFCRTMKRPVSIDAGLAPHGGIGTPSNGEGLVEICLYAPDDPTINLPIRRSFDIVALLIGFLLRVSASPSCFASFVWPSSPRQPWPPRGQRYNGGGATSVARIIVQIQGCKTMRCAIITANRVPVVIKTIL